MQVLIDIVQNFFDGIMVGSSYALLGLGFTLIFGVMRRVNLAYGSVILIGVFSGSTLLRLMPGHPILALLITIAMTVLAGIPISYGNWQSLFPLGGRLFDGGLAPMYYTFWRTSLVL